MLSLTRTTRLLSRCSIRSFSSSHEKKTALVLGSSGSLGSTVSRHLSRQLGLKVIGADVLELPNDSDWELDDFIPLPHFGQHATLADFTARLTKGMDYALQGGREGIDVVVVASGGWQMDPPAPKSGATSIEVQEGAAQYGEGMETMLRMNFYPVAAAGYIVQHFIQPQGLFVVIGATAALSPTPGMIGYGVSKSAAHYYVQTLGSMTGLSVSSKSQRKQGRAARRHLQNLEDLSVVGILPTMLDTPSNREHNPDVDFDLTTKPMDIAKEIGSWVESPLLRPHSGSLVKVYTDKEGTHFTLAR